MQVPLARPGAGNEEREAVGRVLRSGMVARGPGAGRFSGEFAGYCRTRHAIAVSYGTAALHAVLASAGTGAGDEVIVPLFSFIATANLRIHVRGRSPGRHVYTAWLSFSSLP
jgi:perosamine synthetase